EIFESHAGWRNGAARGGIDGPVGRIDQPPDETADRAYDGAGKKESRHRADLVARSDSVAPCGTGAEVSGGELHSAQSQHQHRPGCVRENFRLAPAGEPDSREDG